MVTWLLFRSGGSTMKRIVIVVLLLQATAARAERDFVISSQIDLVNGLSNHPSASGIDLSLLPKDLTYFYGIYPSIRMLSKGAHSAFETSYALGIDRNSSGLDLNSRSHVASATLAIASNPKWKFNLSENFQSTPDFLTFNALRGIILTPEGFQFVFYPTALRRSSIINDARISVERAVSEKSTLSFNVSHALRDYGENPAFQGRLSDQYRAAAGATYTRSVTEHSSFSISYTAAYYYFRDFDNARSHSIALGYSHSFSPTITLNASAGPSYTQVPHTGSNYRGYNANINIQKATKRALVNLYAAHDSGETSGLGSISTTDRAGLGLLARFFFNNAGWAAVWLIIGFNRRQRRHGRTKMRGLTVGGIKFLPNTVLFSIC